jgi:DNA-binding SARP family transcriptional activator/pimeloyl-ACP methyl ester carboxylesterase
MMRFRVLGPLEVRGADGETRDLPAAKERLVVATLLARANSVVGVDTLVDVLWDDDPPRTAGKTLQTYISSVRHAIGADRIVTRAPGYVLRVDDDGFDSAVFVDLAEAGHRQLSQGQAAAALKLFRDALALWRGGAYEEFAGRAFFIGECTRLAELRWNVLEASIDAQLAMGEHQQVLGLLESLVGEHPLRERFWAQLMLAQYRSGRQADALQSYQRARRTLAEQLGIDPGAELRQLEQAVLLQDPALDLRITAGAAREGDDFVPPTTHYAPVGDAFVAYQTLGEGPDDLLYVPDWWSHVEGIWEHPTPRSFLRRLASGRRLVLFDSRGTGLSDPIDRSASYTLEDWVDDARAVLDTVGSRQAVVYAASVGVRMSLLFAAQHPERVRALVLVNGSPSMADTPPGRVGFDEALRRMTARWGSGPGFAEVLPHADEDAVFAAWFARFQRMGVSPGQLAGRMRMFWDTNIDEVAPLVSVPTLVMHRRDNKVSPLASGRRIADLIPGAEFVELDGDDHFWAAGDTEPILAELEAFLDGTGPSRMPERVLATVLVVEMAASAADGEARFQHAATRHVDRHGGRRMDRGSADDGNALVCTFDGPARAMACAWALVDTARQHGLEAGAGLHAGEIDRRSDAVSGPALTLAEAAARQASPGDLVVTRTIVDLVAGSGHEFTALGPLEAAGLDRAWECYRAHG